MLLKKVAGTITAGLLLCLTLAIPAMAATGTVDSGGSPLRVRSEASTSGSILTKLPDGTQVDVLGEAGNGWYQISYQETIGYVSGEYLKVTQEIKASEEPSNAQPAPAAEPAPQAEPAAQAEPTPQSDENAPAEEDSTIYLRVTTSILNIRSGPGTDHDKVGKLSGGKVVTALEVLDDWYKIDSGYVSADYVTVIDASQASSSGKGQEIVDYAMTLLGSPYVYGGKSPRGFDCSGFTSYVYAQCGYSINRTASAQLDNGVPVDRSDLQPGDLVMFKQGSGGSRASHVGIYIGNGDFIHASTSRVGVVINSLSDPYHGNYYIGARRIV